jgi:hypothetical protein
MPWSRAKKLMADVLESPERTAHETDLFNQCFRIQREVSAAAGHYVPLIVENVRGAQKWVGKARWNFGSFYLWGDVPALMPIPGKAKHKTIGPVTSSQAENHNCHINEMRDALKQNGGSWFGGTYAERKERWPESQVTTGSNSKARKQASAEIAKIPKPLAAWIARVFKP